MDGQYQSREVAFSQQVINIGSDAGNDIVLRGKDIGSFHAMLHYDSSRWYVMPLDATCKTLVNGRLVDENGSPVKSRDVITIGDYRLTLALNGINSDIIISYSGMISVSQPSENIDNPNANILLELTGTTVPEIEAGGSAEFELTVTNAGPLVANMQLQVQGISSAWLQIIPPVINLNEGRKGTFSVRVNPPRDPSAEAGVYYLHFIAISPNYQGETTTVDTTLTILPYSEFMLKGPTPRRLVLNKRKPSDVSELLLLNNSNATSAFMLRSNDDANELVFSYEPGSDVLQGQETISVRPGDTARIPMRVGSRKLPLLGFTSKTRHYYSNVTPTDRPTETQSVVGEVHVKPLINAFWLVVILLILGVIALFIVQPYIYHFDGMDGKVTQVIMSGGKASLTWDVSRFATKITLNDGTTVTEVSRQGNQYVSPASSTTYTLKAENIISNILTFSYEKTVQVLVIPNRPSVNVFKVDKTEALYNEQVTLTWGVEPNADTAIITTNRQDNPLTAENYSGSSTQPYTEDSLISLMAQNNSGYDMKSLFLDVAPNYVDLVRFTVWVRPNGIAIPNDNNTRNATRWSSLDMMPTPAPVPVHLQPAAQSNTLDIPDQVTGAGVPVSNTNPEQIMLIGPSVTATPYTYQPPVVTRQPGGDLLVAPHITVTPEPTSGVPQTQIINGGALIENAAAPDTSPEGTGNGYNRDFSVKLVEVVEDFRAESGYRVIDYFPDYQLQPGEQILVEWNVVGVSKLKIDNLAADALNSKGAEYANPEKTVNYVMHAESGQVSKEFSLPVRVAGQGDDGEGSGLKCELKVNAATMKVPGVVTLTWTGGGNNRVQLLSSAKAAKDAADAEKKKKEEAEAKGQPYVAPTNPALDGGIIGDYLQPAGFMRVNVDQQTTFILNAYDGSGNIICSKTAEVKFEGGNDKADIGLKIIRVANADDVEQPVYTVGQKVFFTVQLTGFDSKKPPSGNVTISDGVSSCQVTLPVVTCSFDAKKAGTLPLTAVYAGDDNYNKATARGKYTVINKLKTTTAILAALKPDKNHADLITHLTFDFPAPYDLIPTGTITFTIGSGTCDLDVISNQLTCEGKVVTDPEDGYWYTITEMLLADPSADRVTATYKGDNYFAPSTSTSVLFRKFPTTSMVYSKDDIEVPYHRGEQVYAYKSDDKHAAFTYFLGWDWGNLINDDQTIDDSNDEVGKLVKDIKPTGTITFTSLSKDNSELGKCVYTIGNERPDCEGNIAIIDHSKGIKPDISLEFIVTNLGVGESSDRIKIDYSGDSLFNSSSYTRIFDKIPTKLTITEAVKKADDNISVNVSLQPDKEIPPEERNYFTGKIHFRSGTNSSGSSHDSDSTSVGYTAEACVFNIVSMSFENCTGTLLSSEEEVKHGKIIITNMKMNGTPGDNITAEYSGDSLFEFSTSPTVEFTVIPKTTTDLKIEKAVKRSDKITLTAVLTPAAEETGTIVFTSGNAVCTINIDKHDDISFEKCSGTAVYKDGGIIEITDMVMNNTPGTNIYAEYSGDDNYTKSVSPLVPFTKEDTTLTIEKAAKDAKNLIDMTVDLEPPKLPTRTITFTSGSATCVLNISDPENLKFEACSGTSAKYVDGKIVITGMQMNGTPGDSIYGKYIGDDAYNESTSPSITFDTPEKIDTDLAIGKAYLTAAQVLNLETTLSWDPDEAGGDYPETGTITFSIGSTTCKLDYDLNKPTDVSGFDCAGEETKISVDRSDLAAGKLTWKITDILLSAPGADRVRATYAGDTRFNSSTSVYKLFDTVPTSLDIKDQATTAEGIMKMDLALSWTEEPPVAGMKPNGTIKLTSGNVVCTLKINNETASFADCSADPVNVTAGADGKSLTYAIRNLKMGSGAGTSIKAEYSGNGTFLPSSDSKDFNKVNTELVWEDDHMPYKHGNMLANLTSWLKWSEDEAAGSEPTGTITFTIGSDTCKLDIVTKSFSCSGQTTSVTRNDKKDETDPANIRDGYEFVVIDAVLTSNTADRIKAEYSGDAVFNPSSSVTVLFKTIPTTLVISDNIKSSTGLIGLKVVLNWVDTPPDQLKPTGTIKLTSGSTVCSFTAADNTDKFNDCAGSISVDTSTAKTWTYTITGMDMGSGVGDTIKADYSGDVMFTASASNTLSFKKINTELVWENDRMPYKHGDMLVNLVSWLKWSEDEAGLSVPTGTITFTIGSDTCKLDIETKAFNCSGLETRINRNDKKDETDPDNIKDGYEFEVFNALLSSKNADRVKAEYSGDAVFNPSSSVTVLFRTIETTLTLYGERKTSAGLVNVTTELAWTDDQPAGTSPSGTVKLTSGTAVCTIDLATNRFKEPDCEGTITPAGSQDGKKRIYVIENMKIGDGSGTTLKADYSGDDIFMASVSNTVDFNKVNTTLEITNAYKPSAGMANVDITLSWLPGQVDAGTKPTGTITFTIGSDTCKLDITTKAFNCAGQSTSGLEPDPARSTDTSLVWSIKNIVLSSDTADRVKAEYSGDAVFNPSSSLIVMFQTIPTTTTLSNQSKTPEGLVNVTAELSWTDTPPDSVTPHGQIKFTSGSASCTYSLDTEKLIDCEGTVTPAQPQGEKSRIYTVTGLEIGDGKGTTIKAEYSGDGLFLASASDTLDFNKVDTMLKITDGTKSRENVIGLTTKITWDNQSTSDPNPKGTITYTSGSASCVLNLDTMNFERCSGEASIVNGVITITNMKMNGTPEDNIYAVYSGDNRYNGSTSPTFWFASIEKIDPLLEIVKITDESGVEHSSYFTPGQTVRVETNMAGALDDPAPGGTVTISIDTSTCTITLPQTACLITLPKVVGSTRVVASYGGDANYNPDTAEKAINIQEPKDLTLEIDKIVDDQGVEQEEFGRGQQVTISVNLKDYDPAEIPTGPVTVKVGNSTCTIMRPDESSCKLKLPDVARTYEVTAEYAGNTYYNKAEAEPKEVKVGKYDITFEITAITNIETNDMGNTVYIEQPYYVYDRTSGAGELVRVCAELKDADHGDPSQTVTITVKDEAHDDAATLTTFTVGAKCGTFNVRSYTGTITLTATYPGDDNYVSKKAVKTLDVQNRIKPIFTLYPAYTHYDDPGYGIISFQLSHDSDIPDQYEGISLFEDNSKAKAAEKVQSVTFTFRGTKYQYFMLQNVLYHIIDEDHRELVTDAEITVENGIYTIDNVPFAAGTDNKITAVYDGNRYFYGATDDDSIYKEDGGYTIVNLSDILKIDNPLMGTTNGHMFLKADLSYSEYVYEQHGVKPQGSLVIKAGTTEKTCVFVLDTGSFTLQDDTSRSCGDITEDDGVIHFVIRDLDISPKSAEKVTVQFKKYSEQSLYEDSEIAEGDIITEARPEVTFVETETEAGTQTGAKKTSAETADLVFTIENTGDLTKAYEVYDFVQIGSKSAEDGAVWATCAFDNKTYHWKDSTCSGEITVSGDTYTIRNFTGIIAEDDTLCSVKLMNDDTDITDPEFPSDTAEYWHGKMATTLTITEPLKYKGTNSAHAFLEFSINYNESERAKWGDVYPTGILYFSSVDDNGDTFTRCHIDLETGESEDCSGVILDPVWWLESETGHVLLNARIWPDESKVSLSYNGDAYFEPAPATAYVPYTPESPEIVINNAMHLPDDKVYADFTITGMGDLAEKYRVNHALRFRSNSSGKTCTFNFVNDAFDPGCEGTLVVSGDQFTLKDLTNLYTNGDTEFSVAVVSEYLEESEYVHKEKPYSKLPDTITLSNVLKMMTSHGFVTVDFGYESEISARYGISPTGTFTFSSSAGSCTYDLETKTANGCTVEWDESASSSGNIRLLVKNLPVSGGVSTVSAVYGSDDPFFDEKTADRRVEADLHSVIRLTEALKTTLTKANVKFVISNLDDRYAKIYGSFFEQISLRSNPGHAGYIDISSIIEGDAASGTASLYPGEGSVTWTRDGEGYYTFYVQDWTGTINRDDEQCTAALMSHTYLEESEYPEDHMDFDHRTQGEVTLEVSDVLAAQTNHVYLTVDMDYDADIADSYDEVPSGTLTITGNNGAAERVCSFDLRDGTFELEDDPSISCGTFVLDEPGHHAVFVVRNYETGDSAVTSVSVKYSGNDFFAESNEAAGTAVEETPSIDINAPLVSRNNRVAYVILTVDLGALTKQYGVYTNYRLDSYGEVPQSTSIGHTTCRYYLSDPGSNPCQAEEVVVEGSTLIFKKLDVDYGYNEHSQNKLKVSLENNEWTSDHRNYPYTEKSWWHGISPIMTAYDAFRYSDFHAGLTAKLSVSAAVMRYTDLYDLYPTGTMVFSSGNATCTCNLSDGTCTDGCIATVTEEGSLPITMKVRNLRGTSLGTQVKAEFKRDEFFYYAENTADFTEVIPSITIQSARKTTNTSANLTVFVKGNDHKDLYGDLYNRIRLATHDGAYTEIDISGILAGSETSGIIPGTGGFEKVEWTRNGNNVTFTVTDWRENITAEDTQCVAWLSNSDTTVLPLDHSPISDPEPFSIQKGSVTLSVIGNALRSRNDNAFLDIKLDYDPDVAAAFRKPAGTLNLTARSGITYTDDCTFDLNNGPEGAVTCTTGSAEIIDYDESAHYATIRIRKFYIYRAPSISVNGSGDDHYQYTYASASVTEEIPVVHLNTAVKGADSSGDPVGYLKFTIKTGPLTEKFGPYTRVELYTGPDSGLPVHHDTGFDLDHNEGNFEPPVTGDISVDYDEGSCTYTYMVRNMKGLILGSDKYMRVGLRGDEVDSLERSEILEFEKIPVSIDLSDLIIVVDGQSKSHAFGTISFILGDPAETLDLWPGGWMQVISSMHPDVISGRLGHVNVADGSLAPDARQDFGEVSFTPVQDTGAHAYQILMKNKSVLSTSRYFTVQYNGDSSYQIDPAFEDAVSNSEAYTSYTPVIRITDARKFPLITEEGIKAAADMSFSVTHLDSLEDPWHVVKAIRVSTGSGSRYSDIDLATNQFTDGSGEVRRTGNTFEVMDWANFSSEDDMSITVSLVSDYTDFTGQSKTENLRRTVPRLSVSDMMAMANYRFLTIDMNYTDNGAEPTGEIKITANDATCTYNLSSTASTCTYADILVTKESGHIKILVCGWTPSGNTFQSAYINYGGDTYYSATQSPTTNSVTRVSLPRVKANSANRRSLTAQFTIEGYDAHYSKYPIITGVGLKASSTASAIEYGITVEDLPVTYEGITLDRTGDEFYVTNFRDLNNYPTFTIILRSQGRYWSFEDVSDSIPITSGFGSAAPVSISVGDFQPIGGQ